MEVNLVRIGIAKKLEYLKENKFQLTVEFEKGGYAVIPFQFDEVPDMNLLGKQVEVTLTINVE